MLAFQVYSRGKNAVCQSLFLKKREKVMASSISLFLTNLSGGYFRSKKDSALLRNSLSRKSIREFVPISRENLSAFTGSRALRAGTRGFLPLVNSLDRHNDNSPLFFIIFENHNIIDEMFLLVKATSMYFVNANNHEYLENQS